MTHPRVRLAAVARLLGAMSIVVGHARDARADVAADAKELFARGRELRRKGDCASATPIFRKGYELYPAGLGSLRNLAECEEALGRWASARRDWLELERVARGAHEAKYEGWEADASAAIARIAPRVPHLTIRVVAAPSGVALAADALANVTVRLDGAPVESRLLGTKLDRDPGTYQVRLELVGATATATEMQVTLGTGDDKLVEVPLPSRGVTGPSLRDSRASSAVHDSGSSGRSNSLRATGWVSIGVGGAALIGAAVALAVRQSALADLERVCPEYRSGPCPSESQSHVDRGHTGARWFNILAIGGAALGGAGLALVLSNPDRATDPTTRARDVGGARSADERGDVRALTTASVRVAPFVSAHEGGVAVAGAF